VPKRKRNTKRGKGEGSVFELPNGTWRGKVTVGYAEDGKQRFRWVSGKTQAEALAKVAEIKQQLASGTFADTKLTLKNYLEQWLAHKESGVKPRTVEIYRHLSAYHIAPRIGHKRLDKLTPLDVHRLVAEVATHGGARTANQCRTMLYSAMKQAVRWQLVPRNVVEATDPLKEKPREMVLWTPEEVVRFLDTARAHRLYALFYAALSTGMRRGELLGLRWRDLEGGGIRIRETLVLVGNKLVLSTPKTDKGQRYVTVSPDVQEVLEMHRTRQEAERAHLGEVWPRTLEVYQQHGKKLALVAVENDFVFSSETGTLIHPRNLERTWYGLQDAARDAWAKAVDEAGDVATLKKLRDGRLLPRVRLHDLRHLNVSLRRRLGQDAKLIADQIGHTDPAFTTRLYTHLFEDDRRGAAVSLLNLLPKGDPSTAN
jgi:integrase